MKPLNPSRRAFLVRISQGAAAIALMPTAASCALQLGTPGSSVEGGGLPLTKPADFDPVTFNRERGLDGAIPETYHASITGDDSATAHLGKHLPYVVNVAGVPAGMLAVMFGDASKGNAQHPAAAVSEMNQTGHWFNWVRVRKATESDAQEIESDFSSWPNGNAYMPFAGTDVADNSGKNTVYLVKLPADVRSGDVVRVVGHCISHGEYVDFLTVP